MLGENFGEPLEEFERPSSVIQDPLGKVIVFHVIMATLFDFTLPYYTPISFSFHFSISV